MFFRMSPKIFPEKIFRRLTYPAHLKALAKKLKVLER